MSDMNNTIRRLDGGLLLVFCEIMQRRNLTEAGRRLGLTQSAVSHALRRLREIFGDELFLRRASGVEPTARALELAPRIREIVELCAGALSPAAQFDPALSERTIRIGARDYECAAFGGSLARALRTEAPGVTLVMRPFARMEALQALTGGEIDVALGYFPTLPGVYQQSPLYEEDFLVVARTARRSGGEMSLDEYVARRHLLVSLDGAPRGVVDQALARKGLRRRVVLALPYFLTALATVADTDLIATVPRRLALAFGPRLGLDWFEPPIRIRKFGVAAIVHRRMADDPIVGWAIAQLLKASQADFASLNPSRP